jgi:ribosomal-protein-alanine N-acetyltransferase
MTPEKMAGIHEKCFLDQRPWTTKEFAELLNSKSVFLCANKQGFALGRAAGPEVELLTIAVDPEHQRKGIARDLLTRFEKQALTSGAEEIFLEVAENNVPAQKLYHQFGFTQTGARKDYYASIKENMRISAIVMSKRL